MMNINEELNHIICKYDLDRAYPQFRKMLLAEELITAWMEDISKENKRLLCLASNQCDIKYFSALGDRICDNISYLELKENESLDRELEEYDVVWIISLQSAYIAYQLAKSDIPYVEIYDELQKQGLIFELECYKLMYVSAAMLERVYPNAENIQMEIFRLDIKKQTCPLREKQFYLQRMYFLALYIRDFLYAEKCIDQLQEIEGAGQYARSWEEIQRLLGKLRERLNSRRQEDVLLIWMDNFSYDEADNMPYYAGIKKTGVDFENAFTVMPFTNETAKSIFLGTRVIDDASYNIKEIDSANSILVNYLNERNYLVRVASGCIRFANSLREKYYEESTATSRILWDSLCRMAQTEQPVFFLAHALIESHSPFSYAGMAIEDISSKEKRWVNGKAALDQQMKYYVDLLGENAVCIYMSDHGNRANVNRRSHINLTVKGKKYSPRKIRGMFSLADFNKLVRRIIENDDLDEDLTTDFVKLQELPCYNKNSVGDIIKGKTSLLNLWVGYNGVATEEYIYFKFNTGCERLLRRDSPRMLQDYFHFEDEIEDASQLEYFRDLAGDREVDILHEEKFKYTRYLFEFVDNYKKYSRKNEVINELFSSLKDGNIALRMGGENTAILYSILSPENKEKVFCCVDRNKECMASKMGMQIYPPEEVNALDIKYMIFSTNAWLANLYEEAGSYRSGIEVIDFFDALAKRGIHFNAGENLCCTEILPDEYRNVGFPFDE